MTVAEILLLYGFRYSGRCTCMGPKTDKYKKGTYVVYWSKREKKVRLKNHGKAITVAMPETELEDAIKKFIPAEVTNALN